MKKMMIAAILVACTVMVSADVAASAVSAERRARKRKRITPEMQMEKFGGFTIFPYEGRYCYFMNAQKRVSDETFDWVLKQITQTLALPVRMEKCEPPSNDNFAPIRKAWESAKDTGAVVSVVDIPGWTSILVAPEDGWVQVNIAALAKDSPKTEVLEARTKKELWRAFVMLFGGGNARFGKDLMRPVNSLADLDAFPNLAPGPEPFNAVLDGARARGITCIRRTTYKAACEEGWAPAPTNEYQKAIWDKVHAMPTAPLKIKPETKKVVQ